MIEQKQITTTREIIDSAIKQQASYNDKHELLAAETNLYICTVLENQIKIMNELNEIREQIREKRVLILDHCNNILT